MYRLQSVRVSDCQSVCVCGRDGAQGVEDLYSKGCSCFNRGNQRGMGREGAGDPGALRLLTDHTDEPESDQMFRHLSFVVAAFLQPPSASAGVFGRRFDKLRLPFPSRAVARKQLQRHNRALAGSGAAAGRQKEATAAHVLAYVNGRRCTSAEPKLEAAEVKVNWAPDEIKHVSVKPFQPKALHPGGLL